MEADSTTERRGTRSTVVLLLVVLLVVGAGALVARQAPGWFDRVTGQEAGCRATDGAQQVQLDLSAAQRATTLAGAAWRSDDRQRQLERLPARLATDQQLALEPAQARTVAAVVSGQVPAGLVCAVEGTAGRGSGPDSLTRDGLTPDAARALAQVQKAFGRLPSGGYASGGVDSGHMPGSAHYDGRAVDVFFRPITAANLRHGWAVASYLVAHAGRLRLQNVIYDDRIFSAGRGEWRDYEVDTSGRGEATALILRHRDHVHFDVAP